jgi:HEPN domain-containing protein
MINVPKQIEYWRNTAESDIETASILINSGKYVEGMFFCHLSIEKIIKALVVKQTENIPNRSHDLFYLLEIAKIEFTEAQSGFMQILMKYQLEGRYPEYYPKAPSADKINDYLCQTKTLLQCFSKML